ncbi:60S ribosomal protein L27a-like [Psammomys obesus]|uniref:60S ribosomal protein L27a-like n=1 Tax=Psammomys obesus TaxID=48139 RepID=UPI0024533374|nr:60S ribosomal protein L27a-like [Psammomys obesus]
MPSRLRRTWKLQSHMSHGRDHVGQHHKHRGNAGGIHHLRTDFDKYHPGYFSNIIQVTFGNVGVRPYHLKRNQSFCPTVSLDKWWTLVSEQTQVSAAGAAPFIDVVHPGYCKVPGRAAVITKARSFSRSAEEKRKAVGGACVLVA